MNSHKRSTILVILTIMLLSIVILSSGSAQAAAPQLNVDLATDTGALYYGASGFLYGLSKDGIPSANTITPLNPQVAAQKPEGGLQHPNGDAINVAPYYAAAGGREIQIYMQDIYAQWPYENLGIADYLTKVDGIVDDVLASPNPDFFTYVIFNEPDQIWYWPYYFDPVVKQQFFDDWKAVYQLIKSKHPTARIAGLNFAGFNGDLYYDFLEYARDNNVLPDVITWHELGNEFFTDWYNHYNTIRAHEVALGISPREISINEYGRISGDLTVPGILVQWMTRFENSKVDGSLAYWTDDGSLNNLVTPDNYNQVTGAWWLYKWYGEMTGHTVTVTPPNLNVEGLQGLASLDSSKSQARILLGGTTGDVDVVVQGFGSASYFGSSVHVTVWETAPSGVNGLLPSTEPVLKHEDDYTVTGDQITVPLSDLISSSAYHLIVTPNTDLSAADNPNRYEAEYAHISGNAAVTYGGNSGYSGTYFVEGYGSVSNASTRFSVVAEENGFYNVRLRYAAGPYGSSPATRTARVVLNGETLTDLFFPSTADWSTWADTDVNVFLTAGINNIAIDAYTTADEGAINIDYIEVTPSTGTITSYEAEAAGNTLGGNALVLSNGNASGGQFVGDVGNGAANTLQFNNVNVPTSETYRMVVTFANAESSGGHSYNSQIVDRYAEISVNGGPAEGYYFRNTFNWSNFETRVIDVDLNAGNNTIQFSNSNWYVANIDKIDIAPRTDSLGTPLPPTPEPPTIVQLQARHSGKCVGAVGTSNAANIQQESCDDLLGSQKWEVQDMGSGYLRLRNVNSGDKCADVWNFGTGDGENVNLWTCGTGANQQWALENTDSGYFRLIARHSGKCLDVNGGVGATDDGVNIDQWTCGFDYNQQFTFIYPPTISPSIISWNYDNNGTVEGDSVAGIVSVANWNNSWPNNPTVDLIDNTGAATTLDISYASANGSWSIGGHPGQDADGTYNKELLNGYLNSAGVSSVSISQIPYDYYDIIVYFSSDAAGRTGTVSDGVNAYSFKTIGSASISGANALFAEADAATTTADAANYAVFAGLSGPAQTVEVDIPAFGGIAGFQVMSRPTLLDISIAGNASGYTNTSYDFSATTTIGPSGSTWTDDITYTWMVDGVVAETSVGADLQDALLDYIWTTAGIKTVEVSAESGGKTVTAVHTITITEAPTPASTINWNYDRFGTVEGPYATAGIEPAVYWNNSWPSDPKVDLIDNTGAATTLDISYSQSTGGYSIVDSHPGQDTDGTYNKELLNGYLNSGGGSVSSVSISQIPYDYYDIIVYFSSDVAGRTGTVSDGTSTYSFNTIGSPSISGANALFMGADASTTTADAANYAVFAGLSGLAQTVQVDIPDYGGIAGFQVVACPNDDPQLAVTTEDVVVNETEVASNGGSISDADGDVVILTASVGSVVNNGNGTWSWDYTTDDGPTDSQTVTIIADDGRGGTTEVSFTLTVNNVAPTANAGANQTVFRNETVNLSGSWSDPAGAADNAYTWSWDLDGDGTTDDSGSANFGDTIDRSTSFVEDGVVTLTFTVTDKDGGSSSDTVEITVVNRAPSCTEAAPSISTLWPPNHEFQSIDILNVTDPDGDPVVITIDSIFQDETVHGPGNHHPDGQGVGTTTAEVRAERDDGGNGRFYHISFTASDGNGGSCSGTVQVSVPKSMGNNGAAVDDGALYDSTTP